MSDEEQGSYRVEGSTGAEPAPVTVTPPRHTGRTVAAAMFSGLLLLSSGIGIGWGLTRPGRSATTAAEAPIRAAQPAAPSSGASGTGTSVAAVAARVTPAVVDIRTVIPSNPFRSGGPPRAEAAGTGMVLTSSGEILTNNHVVQGASRIEVAFQGRSGTYAARVVGTDPSSDVALLQVDGVRGLPTVTLADSSTVSIGQQVVAIGNALGRGGAPAVTSGSVTAVGQSISVGDDHGGVERLRDMIRTDVLIQPGDSGGPLINTAGQVVGMITAGSRSEAFQSDSSVGFAIPSDDALRVVNQVRSGNEGGSVVVGEPGYLGIDAANLDAASAARLGLSTTSGALVINVFPGTPAAAVGLSQGAVITAVDGARVRSADELGPILRTHAPGTSVRVTWIDSGGTHTATATLVSGPAA